MDAYNLQQETEPIYGYRYFRMYQGLDGKTEEGLVGDSPFLVIWDKPYMQAQCMVVGSDRYATCEQHLLETILPYPYNRSCGCGIYLKKSYQEAFEYGYSLPYPRIIAYCKAWGICVEGTYGIRCQHVQVLGLESIDKYFIGREFWGLKVVDSKGFR